MLYLLKFGLSIYFNITEKLLNHSTQFLTELDGVEVLTGVFVFAATRLTLSPLILTNLINFFQFIFSRHHIIAF